MIEDVRQWLINMKRDCDKPDDCQTTCIIHLQSRLCNLPPTPGLDHDGEHAAPLARPRGATGHVGMVIGTPSTLSTDGRGTNASYDGLSTASDATHQGH